MFLIFFRKKKIPSEADLVTGSRQPFNFPHKPAAVDVTAIKRFLLKLLAGMFARS
jgi:hypothetical protein